MTDAQRAHLHLMETLPRERIHTHECRPQRIRQRARMKYIQRSPSVIKRHRAWLRRNARHKTRYEICEALRMTHDNVCRILRNMGLTPKISTFDEKSRARREWIKNHASDHTAEEAVKILQIPRRSLRDYLDQLGIRCKPAR